MPLNEALLITCGGKKSNLVFRYDDSEYMEKTQFSKPFFSQYLSLAFGMVKPNDYFPRSQQLISTKDILNIKTNLIFMELLIIKHIVSLPSGLI